MSRGTEPLPPQDLEAEEYVLGAMMLSTRAIEAVSDVLEDTDFYRESHAKIFRAALELFANNHPVDALTVADKLGEQGLLAEIGGKDRIREIASIVPAASNAGHHAGIVRDKSILRSLIVTGETISRIGWERLAPGEQLIEQAEEEVFKLAQVRRRGDFVSIRDIAHSSFSRLEELSASGVEVVGIPTGFVTLDRMMSGLHPGNLIILAGRPSMGKTALAISVIAHSVLHHDPPVPTAFFTLEMSSTEIMNRFYSCEAFVDTDRIQTPSRMKGEDWMKVAQISGRFDSAPLWLDSSGAASMMEIRSKARRLKLREPRLGLIVIDYVQLMTSGERRVDSRNQELSTISRSLKMLATELQLPILLLSQLSRDVERRHDKRPQMSDLRDSGSLEQDADVILLVYRDEYYFPDETDNAGIAEIQIAKQRNGPTGMKKLSFVSRYARFSDIPNPSMIPGA